MIKLFINLHSKIYQFVTTWASCKGSGGTVWLRRRVRIRTKLDCLLEFSSAMKWKFQFVALRKSENWILTHLYIFCQKNILLDSDLGQIHGNLSGLPSDL